MRTTLSLLTVVLATAPLIGQHTLLFTGRFPFKSLDAVNERVGGSINNLEEFDFSMVTPGPGAFAQSLQPATAHQAYYGDGNADGNFTKFAGFKTYFQNIQMGGLFMKQADKANATHDKVFFTVRSNAAPLQFEAFINNGTSVHVLRPGDFVRFTGNGNLEFFVTQDQLDIAAGPPTPTGTSAKGASAMCQDALGNLYYSPASGGHWVNGNQNAPQFANDGSIVMIDFASITYDPAGNVAAIVPNSAHILFEEANGGAVAFPLSVRQMFLNAAASDRSGGPLIIAGIFGKLCGLDLDPAGGTCTPTYPDINGNFLPAPNFLMASDAGSYAGTILSTANLGSIAVINGVTCGSGVPGVPANGSWLGVQLDVPNSQPSLMGLCVVDQVPFNPLVLDMPSFGAVQPAGTQPLLEIDAHGQTNQFLFVFADFPAGPFPVSVPTFLVPLPLAQGCHNQAFPIFAPLQIAANLTDPFGYVAISFPNPHLGQFTGVPVLFQGATLDFGTALYQVSNPVLMQFK